MLGLNLGSGEHTEIGQMCRNWVNVDKYPQRRGAQPDVLADVLEGLPFPDGHFSRAYLGHICEHFGYDDELPAVLREVERVLKSGGELRVVGPCLDKAMAMGENEALLDIIRAPKVQTQAKGLGHMWTATTDLTLRALRNVFPNAEEIPVAEVCQPTWPNPSNVGWQCAFKASRA